MRMAELADASCLLVGDIDRVGVFASLLGRVELLEPHEQDRIAGSLINKFRGDVRLLQPGVRMIEERLRKSCMGVIPYLPHLSLYEEDSLGLPPVTPKADPAWDCPDDPARTLRVAVIALPSFSNCTDFDLLRSQPSVSIRFCTSPEYLAHVDIVILPGSKQTAHDLAWLRSEGLAGGLIAYAQRGLVVGICGGMQMLGKKRSSILKAWNTLQPLLGLTFSNPHNDASSKDHKNQLRSPCYIVALWSAAVLP